MKARLAVTTLHNAMALRRPVGTTVHSDRGSQFRSRKYVEALRHNGLVGSMGRVGACGDNAAMQSFFAYCKKTCSTSAAGQPARNCAWPSSPGSSTPTTDAADRPASDPVLMARCSPQGARLLVSTPTPPATRGPTASPSGSSKHATDCAASLTTPSRPLSQPLRQRRPAVRPPLACAAASRWQRDRHTARQPQRQHCAVARSGRTGAPARSGNHNTVDERG